MVVGYCACGSLTSAPPRLPLRFHPFRSSELLDLLVVLRLPSMKFRLVRRSKSVWLPECCSPISCSRPYENVEHQHCDKRHKIIKIIRAHVTVSPYIGAILIYLVFWYLVSGFHFRVGSATAAMLYISVSIRHLLLPLLKQILEFLKPVHVTHTSSATKIYVNMECMLNVFRSLAWELLWKQWEFQIPGNGNLVVPFVTLVVIGCMAKLQRIASR